MKSILKTLALSLIGLAVGLNAHAYEVKNICAKYQTQQGWSKAYEVQAQIYSEQEYFEAIGQSSLFANFLTSYVVIWWDYGQASIIKLDGMYSGSLLFSPTGVDQGGRQWRVADYSPSCLFI